MRTRTFALIGCAMLVLAGCGGPGSGWNPLGWMGDGSSEQQTLVPEGGYPTAVNDGRMPLSDYTLAGGLQHASDDQI